jgi:hypothetical protein
MLRHGRLSSGQSRTSRFLDTLFRQQLRFNSVRLTAVIARGPLSRRSLHH